MNPKTCPACHAPIPADAPGGFCPSCLLREVEEPAPIGHAAPSLEEIAAAFPQWEIIRLIGQGGMGFVYQARQPSLDRTVALKILAPELGRDPAFAERFAREARTLGKLHHPNIVTIFEHGESGGFFYLLMEFVDGVNLRQAMRAGRFTPEQALALVPPICDALHAAHAQGVWHRDIKPENILLDTKGAVKIADFGIARIVGDPHRDFTLTMTGGALGSAAYMAPEQHENPRNVDHRADIYSLGVVIYEMLTGELPLGRFPAPSQRADVNARIDEIVFRTLEKERELRQQSAEEVKTEIGLAGRERSLSREEKPSTRSWNTGIVFCWAIGLLIVSFVLLANQGRAVAEGISAFTDTLLGITTLFSIICAVVVLNMSSPGRLTAIFGVGFVLLNLLLLAENQKSIPLVMGAAVLAVLSSFGAWILNGSKLMRGQHPTQNNVKTSSGPMQGVGSHPQIIPNRAHEQWQYNAVELKTEVEGAERFLGRPVSRDLPHSTNLPPFVLWALGLLIGGVALAPSGFYIMLKFRGAGGGPIGISAMIIGGLSLVFGLLGCLWRLYEIKRGRVPAAGRLLLIALTIPTLAATMFGVIAFSISTAEKFGWHLPSIFLLEKETSASSPNGPAEAMQELLEAARNGNGRVFREGLSQSFREVIDQQRSGPYNVGIFDKVEFVSATQLDENNAYVVLEATDGSKRRGTMRMIREDGKWKLTGDDF